MYRACKFNIGRSAKIREEIKKFARKLGRKIKAYKIYLFGSFARGDFSEASDIDLLIIGDFRKKFLDRYADVRRLTKLPIEPFCYTREEFERMRRSGNAFIKNAIRGKLIYTA